MIINQIKQIVTDWPSMCVSFGVPEEIFSGKSQPCCICGGVDRWVWYPKKIRGYCRGCEPNSKDGIDLIRGYNGWDYKTTVKELAELLEIEKKEDTPYKKTKNKIKYETEKYKKALQYYLCGIGSLERGKQLTLREYGKVYDAHKVIEQYRASYNYMEIVGA